MVSKYFACRPPSTLGSKAQNPTFSEHDLVAFQIKGNHICSNIVTEIFCWQTPHPPHYRSVGFNKSKFNFSERGHVAYQIKGNHKCSNLVANIYPADPPPPPDPRVKRSKCNFFRTWSCCLRKLRAWSIEHHASIYSLLTHTLNLWVGLKGKTNLNVVRLHTK